MMASLLVSSLTMLTVEGQGRDQQLPAKAFEVSSVKHNTSGDISYSGGWQPRRFVASNIKLDVLVMFAFNLPTSEGLTRHLVDGGISEPRANCTRNCASRDEILTAHFDVQGALAEEPAESERAAILRRLLEDRFQLKWRFETREMPVYALTVAREGQLGPQLRRSEQDCAAWFLARRKASGASPPEPTDAQGRPLCAAGPMSRLNEGILVRRGAGEFSSLVREIRGDMDRLIVDRTGLVGKFEWELASEIPGVRALAREFVATAPTIDVALQEQLGLRLVRSTAPIQVLIIDSIEMPTPN